MDRKVIATAAILGVTAIALGAFGAHGLKKLISPESIIVFETGIKYQIYHALFLLFVGSTNLLTDKDMIVMYHKVGYELNGETKQIDATMVCIGDDQTYTAMAKTVGLPVAIAALKILNGAITTPGVQLPVSREVYLPILEELEAFNVIFHEKHVPYMGYNPQNVAS